MSQIVFLQGNVSSHVLLLQSVWHQIPLVAHNISAMPRKETGENFVVRRCTTMFCIFSMLCANALQCIYTFTLCTGALQNNKCKYAYIVVHWCTMQKYTGFCSMSTRTAYTQTYFYYSILECTLPDKWSFLKAYLHINRMDEVQMEGDGLCLINAICECVYMDYNIPLNQSKLEETSIAIFGNS